jgi:flavin-binding protein dodecin
VRQAVELHHSIELPGFSPYSAVQELVSRHQTSWEAAAAGCVASAQRQLLQLVLLHVNHTCVRFPPAADHIRCVSEGGVHRGCVSGVSSASSAHSSALQHVG